MIKNKRAYFDYTILDEYEAGIVLKGSEVKSIKNGQMSLRDSFIQIRDGEAWLWNAHIPQYQHSNEKGYDPERSRKLLLKKREIEQLAETQKKGRLTIIPLKVYIRHGVIKVKIGLAKGKKRYEKKHKQKERTLERELHKEKRKYMVK